MAEPTRVVCREILNSVRNHFGPEEICLAVKNMKSGNRHRAKIVVMAHATAARMIISGDPLVRGVKAVILDESHTEDPATEILKDFC